MAGLVRASVKNCALLLLLLAIFAVSVVHAQDGTECSASKPCARGCCSKWGFCGYGKDFCHKDNCVNNCDVKSECDPGGQETPFAEMAKCPLNVCCSKHGWCGVTDEFCGDKKIEPPSCGKSHNLQRVVGYYEGWSVGRACNKFMPEQIPMGVYTHINFAFATIDPKTFEVRPASTADTKYYKRLTFLKKMDPKLKILIAIGGWSFNDPGPTATTFSDIARSEDNQKAFIKSLVSFMSTYNFDGVDLDWEYPAADDRSGRKEDFKNFPKFVANLKKALKGTGRDEISLTLPASYWYLQHFDIVNLEKNVDFFNVMSYDLHGTWDLPSQWVGPYLNAHTNLTEIKQAMDLIWRNKISPDKVVLGLGFYGRAFTATSPNCLEPGCTYESGGPRQKCSKEVSVMLNSEIVEAMERTGAKPKLYKDAAVKVLAFDGTTWVGYDDEDTFQLKADFAREQCLGGLMVWAVSGDTKDGRFSKAVAKAANRKVIDALKMTDDGLIEDTHTHPQCKWTNCGESCPANWIRMMRSDSGARKDEAMTDTTGCSAGTHTLCCPPEGDTPTCGWYTHNNGKCDHTCPSGTFEIGSLKKHCRKDYQSACCTTGSSNTKLYEKCSWTDGPRCDDYSCSSGLSELVLSTTGSGGAECNVRKYTVYGEGEISIQERKMCCDEGDENNTWDDCQWYDNLGIGPADSDGFCRSGCPSDRVRVAMDQYHNVDGKHYQCYRGARSKCCLPKSVTLTKRESPHDSVLRDELSGWLKDPICSVSKPLGGIFGRSLNGSSPSSEWELEQEKPGHNHPHGSYNSINRRSHGHGHDKFHAKRQKPSEPNHNELGETALFSRDFLGSFREIEVTGLILSIITRDATLNQLDIWDDLVPDVYSNLNSTSLYNYVNETNAASDDVDGWKGLATRIACNLGAWNKIVGGQADDLNCACDTDYCCPTGGDWCADQASITIERRSSLLRDGEEQVHDLEDRANGPRPGESRTYTIDFPDGSPGQQIQSQPYPPAGLEEWDFDDPIWDLAFFPVHNLDCVEVYPEQRTSQQGVPGLHLEHIMELNTIARFFTHALAGTLPSGALNPAGRISPSMVRQTLITDYPAQGWHVLETFENGWNSLSPIRRLFTSLGSYNNLAHFVLLNAGLNTLKSSWWTQSIGWSNHLRDVNMENLLWDPETQNEFLLVLREAVTAINYLRDPTIWTNLLDINRDIRRELDYLEDWHEETTGISDNLVDSWDYFLRDHLESTVREAQNFVSRWVTAARNYHQDDHSDSVIMFLARVNTLGRYARDLELPYEDLTDPDDIS